MQLRGGSLPAENACDEDIPYHASDSLNFLPDIVKCIDELDLSLWRLNTFIHENPELGFREHKAHDALTGFLHSQREWEVKTSAYGMVTAWEAVFDSGRPGPVVAFNAEMDALPNLGHACGHNLIAVASLAAALATAHVLRAHGLPGRVVLLGTPAEEGGGGGKIKCLEAGAYENVDAAFISHPGILNNSPMVRTTAYTRLEVTYHGRAAHAANAPWMGINALDALVTAYTAISALRQQTRPDDIIGLQITDGGNRPNVIHERAAGVAVLRAATAARLAELQRRVEACFRAGADAAGAKAEIRVVPGYKDHVPNRVLATSYRRYWDALPGQVEPALPSEGVFTHVKASTDQGNLSYVLPSVNVSFAIPPGKARGQPHSPDFEKASATKEAFDRAMRVAKAMAGMAVDLCATPGLLGEVRRQWERDMVEFGGLAESPR